MQEDSFKLKLQSGQIVCLSREIMDWPAGTTSMGAGDPHWQKHYEPWSHANTSLAETASEQDRASAIFQLKRSLEFREKSLNNVYGFDGMPGVGKRRIPALLEMSYTSPR
jgi:hypothetical protein